MTRVALLLLLCACATAPPQVPIAITGATLIDGSGSPPQPDVNVIVSGDRIVSVGAATLPRIATVIDGTGLILAPGFIDIHNHGGLEHDSSATTQVSQGITTVVLGQDGSSGSFPDAPVAVNVLTFAGHSTVRERVMGENDTARAATPEETRAMAALVREAMQGGALGLSSGLEYEAAKHSTTEEVIELARAAGEYGGIYMTHIRDEAQRTFESLEEAIRIGAEAGVPVQISHIKMGSVSVWGGAPEAVRMIEAGRSRGLDITADCYPYDAWHSTIRVLVPSGRHDDPDDVAAALAENGGADRIMVVHCEAHRDYEFKTLQQIAEEKRTTPVDVYMQIVRDGGARVVAQSMKEEDVRVFYQQPWVMIGSDGGVRGRHPRGAGTFPRVLGRYVRERQWLTLEEAIRKMTSAPAARLKLHDRGLIRAGMKADLVLFDPERVIDRSTYQQPQLIAEGIERVFVNGVEVWRGGNVTGARPGRALRVGTPRPSPHGLARQFQLRLPWADHEDRVSEWID